MLGRSKRFLAIALFTVLLILLVNLAWWIYYQRTEALLEQQLSRRLSALALTAAAAFPPSLVSELNAGRLDAFAQVTSYLEQVRAADSLSELFVLSENYSYLATTLLEPDSCYFLATLNGRYIDSLFYSARPHAIVTPSYRTGSLYLKSAFASLPDTSGAVIAVLGVEASVDYFDALVSLKTNLAYATALSLSGSLLLGLLFLLLQRGLNRAEQRLFLNQTHAYLGRMVAVVAHEIRNPLMIIRASAERLVKRTSADEAHYIVEETDRLNGIVTGYLDFAKADGPLLSGEAPESFDLAELLNGLRQHLRERYPDQPIQWLTESPSVPVMISAYRRSLRQVILNLLINAVDACHGASKPIVVDLHGEVKAHRCQITVSDHGPGISPKERRRLFEPFHTTKQAGSGLGLYLSQKIVAEMGGIIKIESQEGTGTTMIIDLPHKVNA